MTKTLTEQWRDGTLPEGCYYVRFFTTKQPYIEICGSEYLGNLAEFNGTDRAEVLAPVPSYDEYQKLQKRLEIATKALKDITLAVNMPNRVYMFSRLQQALKEMEGVK